MNNGIKLSVLALSVAAGVSSIFFYSSVGNKGPLLSISENYPKPIIPEENPLSWEKVELGRHLFYDKRLSLNENISCASCHKQALAFTDDATLSEGSTGELTKRNSMSLVNISYHSRLTWANPLMAKLESQLLVPLFGEEPIEMGMNGKEDVLIQRISQDRSYQKWFATAFPHQESPITIQNIADAIASFERTIISFNAPYDQYLAGNKNAMTEAQIRGMQLFFSEKFECFHCHGGFNFMDSINHKDKAEEVVFHNNGLYDATQGDNTQDPGIYEITKRQEDKGMFKAPSLRNIAKTAPYMHDGRFATLEGVIEHYASGVGSGSRALPNTSDFVKGFEMSESEKQELIDFLHALTDESVLTNPRFSDPWK